MVIILLGACDQLPKSPGLAVTTSRNGAPFAASISLCEDDRVEAVRVVRSENFVIGDDDDEVLWRIDATTRTSEVLLEYSQVPSGFEQTRPPAPITAGEKISVVVDAASGDQFESFQPEDLSADVYVSDGVDLTLDDFEAQASAACA
jgi:hypothetical protein